jgi:hypothetical protein
MIKIILSQHSGNSHHQDTVSNKVYLLNHKLPVRDPRRRCCRIAASPTRLQRACRPRLKYSAPNSCRHTCWGKKVFRLCLALNVRLFD